VNFTFSEFLFQNCCLADQILPQDHCPANSETKDCQSTPSLLKNIEMNKTALLLGGTGETGKEVLNLLVRSQEYKRIVSLGRRKIDIPSEHGWDKVEQKIVDFENLDKSAFENVDSAFCCLGTTRGKAGKEGFIKVDHDYVLSSAQLLKDAACPDFHLLTSRGSNKDSWFLYPQTKGQVEEAIGKLGFDRLSIYRPGLLLCDRVEQRTTEKMLRWVASWFPGSNSWAISTKMVAEAMVKTSLTPITGAQTILEHSDIIKIAEQSSN